MLVLAEYLLPLAEVTHEHELPVYMPDSTGTSQPEVQPD